MILRFRYAPSIYYVRRRQPKDNLLATRRLFWDDCRVDIDRHPQNHGAGSEIQPSDFCAPAYACGRTEKVATCLIGASRCLDIQSWATACTPLHGQRRAIFLPKRIP